MSKTAKIVLAVVILVAVTGGAAFAVMRSRNAGTLIDTAEARKTDLAVTVTASGKVESGARSDVYPPSAGTIESVDVKDGQRVRAGQILARMDTVQLELQAEQALAGAAQARAQLAQADAGAPSSGERSAAAAAVAAAEAQYDAAADAYDAAADAREALPSAMREAMEATLTQLSIAKKQAYAGVLQARAQQSKLRTDTSAQRRAAIAALDQSNEAYAAAQRSIKKATMRAPIDGVVLFNAVGTPNTDGTYPKAQVGTGVSPQVAPFSIVALNELLFDAEVDEADVDKVKTGLAGTVTLDAFPDKPVKSKVVRISDSARVTATGGTVFPVYMSLYGVPLRILLGMQGDVDIRVRGVANAVVIPVEALFEENDAKYVFVVESGVLRRRDVVAGATTDTDVQLVSGLAPGEVVALSGATELQDGMSVRTR